MGRPVNTKSYKNSDESYGGSTLSPPDASRIVFLTGEVAEHSVAPVISQLLLLSNHNINKPIHLVVSTYGGSVDEMFSLYDTIKFLPCPVYTVGMGKVMSAGVLLLSAGQKGHRLIGPNARIMMHPISGGAWGNVFNVKNEALEHERLQSLMVECLSKETTMTKDKVKQIMELGYDNYITPSQAIELGIVDKLIGDK